MKNSLKQAATQIIDAVANVLKEASHELIEDNIDDSKRKEKSEETEPAKKEDN